jgi:pimeloyl-ACP methyl ester carboxylesterase
MTPGGRGRAGGAGPGAGGEKEAARGGAPQGDARGDASKGGSPAARTRRGDAATSRGENRRIEVDGIRIAAYLARPVASAASGSGRRALVLCHGFPVAPTNSGALSQAEAYQELADRLAGDSGWTVLAVGFRGTGESEGDFSLGGWLADLKAGIEDCLSVPGVEKVWLCGFAAGGTLALCAAGEDPRVQGVAAFAAPADFGDRAGAARRFVAQARAAGIIRTPGFPSDLEAWGRELREIRPLSLIGKIPPRPVLLVHGANDEVVPLLDARALADAAEGEVELRVLAGAGHRLRHDPRAIALLIGWLDRQTG